MKYVINNADDFGYRPNVSKGIIKAHEVGCLTSTTVLVNSITIEEITLAKANPNLGLGLHLNITSGEAITEKWKSKYGNFTRPKRNLPDQFDRENWIPFFEKFEESDVYEEYMAQVELFIEFFGSKPTHLDSHHYTSSFNKIFPAFVKIAKEYQIPVRNQVMFDFKENQHPMGNIAFIDEKNKMLKENGIKTTDTFSLLYFNRYENYLDVILDELNKVKNGQCIELSWHPGFDEEWREKDLSILTDNSVKRLFDSRGFKLINFNDLAKL